MRHYTENYFLEKQMMMKKLLFLCIVLLSAGCGSGSRSGETELTDLFGMWELHELNGREVSAEQLPSMALQEHGALNGFAGCNIMNGTFTANDDGEITFGEIITTRMSCPDSEMENSLLELLRTAERFSIKEDRLTISAKGKSVAIFKTITL